MLWGCPAATHTRCPCTAGDQPQRDLYTAKCLVRALRSPKRIEVSCLYYVFKPTCSILLQNPPIRLEGCLSAGGLKNKCLNAHKILNCQLNTDHCNTVRDAEVQFDTAPLPVSHPNFVLTTCIPASRDSPPALHKSLTQVQQFQGQLVPNRKSWHFGRLGT